MSHRSKPDDYIQLCEVKMESSCDIENQRIYDCVYVFCFLHGDNKASSI